MGTVCVAWDDMFGSLEVWKYMLREVMILNIRELGFADLRQLMKLYTQLHDNDILEIDDKLERLWSDIISDNNHHIVGGFINKEMIASCVIVIIPNLTHNQRPYALIENVITHGAYRNKGYATAVLNFAREIAINHCCYKIMLLTGSKKESTLNFYEKAGYNRHDKTAFIQWL